MNTQDKQKEKELRSAAFRGDIDTLNRLLMIGIDPNAQDEEGNTALIEAAQAPSPEAVMILLEAGADTEIGDHEKSTPLMWAIRSTLDEHHERSMAVVRLLIEREVNVNARTDSGATALIYAVRDDVPEIVGMLLVADADPNAVTNGGWTALDYANEDRLTNGETKELLLAAGAIAKLQGHSDPNRV